MISHFEPYVQSICIDSMMLSGIKLIAENNNANEIYVFPNSADIRIKEEKVSPADVYKRYRNQGFDFDDENADMTAENNKMVLNIII